MDAFIWSVCAVFACVALVHILNLGRREDGLPPGPRTLPVLGNLASLPSSYMHVKFTEWAREFGPIYSLKIGSNTTIVLTGADEVHEILERRSAITSDRPLMHITELLFEGRNLSFARYGDYWRLLRRLAYTILSPQATASNVLPIQRAEGTQLLYDFLIDPKNFYHHIERFSNSVIMSLLFGKRSPRIDTQHTTDFFRTAALQAAIIDPAKSPPVDLFPPLKYVPERWAKWKRDTKTLRQLWESLFSNLTKECLERMQDGNGNGCYMETILKDREGHGLSLLETASLGGIMVEAGSETSATVLQWIVLFLLLHPEVQRKAQMEIDSVVQHRIPCLEDYSRLPYIHAIIRETHRIRPVLPFAVQHKSTEIQEYKGYIIPAGTTIIANQWGIFHDPDIFEDPETFNPERFILSEHGTKPGVDGSSFRASMPFGYGRRMCPGIHVATNNVMLNTLLIIWAFNISPTLDVNGNAILPDPWDFPPAFMIRTKPFQCQIAPRTTEIANLIVEEYGRSIDVFKPFEQGLGDADLQALKERAELFR